MARIAPKAKSIFAGVLFAGIATTGSAGLAQALEIPRLSSSSLIAPFLAPYKEQAPVANETVVLDYTQKVTPDDFIANWDKMPKGSVLSLVNKDHDVIATIDDKGIDLNEKKINSQDIAHYFVDFPDNHSDSVSAQGVAYTYISASQAS